MVWCQMFLWTKLGSDWVAAEVADLTEEADWTEGVTVVLLVGLVDMVPEIGPGIEGNLEVGDNSCTEEH